MMRYLYCALTLLAAPLAFAGVVLRGLRAPAYRQAPWERFGWGRAVAAPSIWLHAVSLGEVSAAAALVRALRDRHPHMPFVLTTATPTGRARAVELFGAEVDVRFLPYDTPGSVRRFLARVRPRVGIIMETELWPNLFHACARQNIPVAIVSARITKKSAAGYRRFGRLFADAAASCALIAAQTAEDAERFVAVGAERSRTHVVGNVKFDMQLGEDLAARGRELRTGYLGSRPVWVAGSTHAGEEDALVAAQAELRGSIADALLVLVPRHPQRFDAVAAALSRQGVIFERRSRAASVAAPAEILLVDRMGELTAFYAASDAAFVGGSLVPVGGHNLLEPAALGLPVLTGPYTANSKEIARTLIERGGAIEVGDAPALAASLRQLFADPALRRRLGEAARDFVEAHRGSLARLLQLLEPLIAA
jgi:3-deoxy-D-manno-octulosonic-acid transferase